ncbi:zf-HC2 domain-containing protein [bacterium]|nr:zf-HC2 domain-containing protein [bacterium]
MKDCQAILDLLPLHARGDLEPPDLARVTAHLETCPACRTEAEAWRAALRGLDADLPPDLDTVRLEHMIGAAARHLPPARPQTAAVLSLPRAWFSLAAAASVAGLLLWPALRPSPGPRVPPTLQALEDIFQGCLEFPVLLSDWQAEPGPGVVTVLAPDKHGDLIVTACLEAADLSRLRSYPWARQRIEEWSRDSGNFPLLVSVCRMDEDDPVARRAIRRRVLSELDGGGS